MKDKQLKKTALISALLLEMGFSAHAATINVDGNTCTLADAITAANSDAVAGGCAAGSGDDVLELDSNGSPFTQVTQLPTLSSNITINGNGSIVERDLNAPEFRVLYIDGGTTVLNDLTVTGGSISPNNFGAGVVVRAGTSLVMNRCIVSGNKGGAVWFYNSAPSNINDSVIENNTSNAGQYYNGGVSINGGILDINNTTIAGNSNIATSAGGGGLYVTDFAAAVTVGVTNSTITGNDAQLSGGGIASIAFGNGIELNLNNTTVTLNTTAESGGGMANSGVTTNVAVSQSLLSGNTAVILASQWIVNGSNVTVDNYNMFGESSNAGLSGVVPGASDLVPKETAAGIFDATLANNGGLTPTHALVSGGPAVDAVPAGSCLLVTDQTGKSRPIDGNVDGSADCDVGAFENINPDIIFEDGFE